VSERAYTLLPFTFRKVVGDATLLVNQAGEHHFVPSSVFDALVRNELPLNTMAAADLESRHFIAVGDVEPAMDLLATKLRTRKSFLTKFTSLHMVVLTAHCNCRCSYCQVSSTSEPGTKHMNVSTASRVVELIFQSPSPVVKIEFQGGEPTLNWTVLETIVRHARRRSSETEKRLELVLCTNMLHLTDSMLAFLAEHHIGVSTSLDGPADLHDLHRVSPSTKSTHAAFTENLARVNATLGEGHCSPLVTLTSAHLPRLEEVVDEYVRLGFQGIFLRPVNPYGIARQSWEDLSFPAGWFLNAYKRGLAYIIDLNRSGIFFPEFYTTLLLTRILTPFSTGFMDLQSPAGAGISGVIYDYDGAVYPSDEARMIARMGDTRFLLGNVHDHSFDQIFLGSKLRTLIAASCVEALPGCAWCAYQQFCGSDPIRNYVESGRIEGHQPTSDFCRRHMGMLDHLFALLRENDPSTLDIFWSWITNRPLHEVAL